MRVISSTGGGIVAAHHSADFTRGDKTLTIQNESDSDFSFSEASLQGWIDVYCQHQAQNTMVWWG